MGLIAADYKNELAALLPHGPAWNTEESSTLTNFLDSWSQELARVQDRADVLSNDVDPHITYELLTDYERIFGLPTDCMADIPLTLQQRHNILISQMTSSGGQSRAYFIALALAAGFVVTIIEFKPFDVTGHVVDLIYGADWAYAWQINSPAVNATHFVVTSLVDESLGTWGNQLIECIINRYRPAHTITIFSYS